ncbi:MAG: hypothetical protein C4K60_20985 [Ideonella sp. MAG2]|nr:MAG: hypothetical protein C4K60_20985 [Ideonella sp. MAG2]
MTRMRIEITHEKADADDRLAQLKASGFKATEAEPCEIVWVTDHNEATTVHADFSDKEIWVVVGRK